MPRKKRKQTLTDRIEELSAGGATLRIDAGGKHRHTAELHGEAEARHLRPWARRAVLSAGGRW